MSARRALSIVVLLALVAAWVPATAATPPSASEVLLDVAASHPNLLVRINTYEELEQVNIHPNVRVQMIYAIAYGSWILTTRTAVTSGRYTGRPWLAIGGHARYFYFAYESGNTFVGDGSDDPGDGIGGVVGAADGKSVSEFGANLTDIGNGIAALGAAKGNAKAVAIGVGIAGLGVTINAVGLGMQVVEDFSNPSSPKQGHVDGPVGMPGAGGPPGSDPNGPTGQSPPGAVGVVGGGVSGGGGEGGGGDVGDPGDD